MEYTNTLASIMGPAYLVFGLSFLLYTNQWSKVVKDFEKNHFGMLSLAIMALIMGLIIIRIHNVWTWGLEVAITLTGWAMFVKGVYYLLAPETWIKATFKWKAASSENWLSVWAILMGLLGVVLTYNAYLA
ncbi:hypothetical protein IPJ72_02535 [Candidatus Peregrinibacteria bacterium]|nr:MAG: hypothetical protein IPJ72_02535 [Candidatus Peregrinibacteria bacterium]